MHSHRLPAARFLLALLPALPAAAYTIGDGVFDPSDWSHEVRFDAGFTGVSASVSQVANGGNLGPYRSIGYSMTWAGTQVYGSVYVISRHLDFVYDPSVLGAIASLSYEEDQTRLSAGWSPALVAGNAVLFQAGKIYLGPNFVFGPNNLSWTERSFTGLTAADFVELDGMNVLTESHPDFSASAPTLGFGYSRSNSYSFSSSISHGIDNWFFTVESAAPVPEPAAAAGLAGLAALGCAALRRRPRA
jgi:hypothetical protein